MFNTGKAKQGAAKSRDITWATSSLCTALWLVPVLNIRHSAQVVLAQRNKNGSAQVPKNQMSIATISVLGLWFSGLIDVWTSVIYVCIYTLSRSKHFVVFLNWNQHRWDRWHAVTVVLAIEICVELVFIHEMTLPIIPIPSDRPIMAVPIFRSSDPQFFRKNRSTMYIHRSLGQQ